MNYPLVSVIIPSYNYANYIAEAIKSVSDNTYPNEAIEVIIVDDGSSDGTAEVVKAVQADLDLNIQYHYQDNKGKANATRRAIEMSKGMYIFNLDADDYFLPHKIMSSVELFTKHPSVVHVSNPALIDDSSRTRFWENIPARYLDCVWPGKKMLVEFYRNNIFYGGGTTFVARAKELKQIEIPDDVDMYTDEYLVCAALCYGDSYITSVPASVWREHDNNYSGGKNSPTQIARKQERLLKSSLGTWKAMKEHLDIPSEVLEIYAIRHAIRDITAKEKAGTKTFRDMKDLAVTIYQVKGLGLSVLRNQYILPRFLPQFVFNMLKKGKLNQAQKLELESK